MWVSSRLSRNLAALVLLGALPLVGCLPQGDPVASNTSIAGNAGGLPPENSPILNGFNTSRGQALMTLDVLGIQQASLDGFDESRFAIDLSQSAAKAGWEGANIPAGCTIKDAALMRDGHSVKSEGSCKISSGRWYDPLSGSTNDIDAASPLGFLPAERVWASGGNAWDAQQYTIYRDSPQSVLTMSANTYAERGQRGPANWKPADRRLWCGYALRWVSAKNTFGLYMEDRAEEEALREMLGTCPDEGFLSDVA